MRQAVEEASAIDFREVIEPKPVITALLAASSALLVAALPCHDGALDGSDRPEAVVSFRLRSTSWPQRTHLVLDEGETTLKVARGDSFTLSVKVRPGDRIPESAQATYHFCRRRFDGRAASLGRGGRVPGTDRVGQSAVPLHGDRRRRSLVDPRCAGQGGAPPTLKSLAIRLIPPEYTGTARPGAGAGTDAASCPGGNEARARSGRQQAAG